MNQIKWLKFFGKIEKPFQMETLAKPNDMKLYNFKSTENKKERKKREGLGV